MESNLKAAIQRWRSWLDNRHSQSRDDLDQFGVHQRPRLTPEWLGPGVGLLSHNLTVALRRIGLNPGISFINIFSLAVGMACALLSLLWIQHELSYDRFHDKADNLYRIEQDQSHDGRLFRTSSTSGRLAPILEEELPELVSVSRFTPLGRRLIGRGQHSFYETGIAAVDPSFLTMFSFALLRGNLETALSEPNSIVISEGLAWKYFGTENPVGRSLTVDGELALNVTGVLSRIPSNSSIRFQALVPIEVTRRFGSHVDTWTNSLSTYVELPAIAGPSRLSEKVQQIYRSHRPETSAEMNLVPLTDARLRSDYGYNPGSGDVRRIYVIGTVGLIILLIGCINFMNLATAQSSRRAKEIAMRKVSGAGRGQIVVQYLGETLVITMTALVIAYLIAGTALEPFNLMAGKSLELADMMTPGFVLLMTGIALMTAVVAGSYPSFLVSNFRPLSSLQGSDGSTFGGGLLRKALVTFQFSVSAAMIIIMLVVFMQWDFMQDLELGFDQDHLALVPLGSAKPSYPELRERWLAVPGVLNVSASTQALSKWTSNGTGADWDGKTPDSPDPVIHLVAVNYGFLETAGIALVEGRTFSQDHPADMGGPTSVDGSSSAGSWVVNQTMASLIDQGTAVGVMFSLWGRTGPIIGVVEDYHFIPAKREMGPLAIRLGSSNDYALIRMDPDVKERTLSLVKTAWEDIVPVFPFQHSILGEDIAERNGEIVQTGVIISYAAGLVMLIACLGLLGLVSFVVAQRRKEIGIRRVLGSSTLEMVLLLLRDFLGVLALAILIGSGLGYFAATDFLEGYAQRVPLTVGIFVICGLITMSTAVLAVSFKSVQASLANPVDSIRLD